MKEFWLEMSTRTYRSLGVVYLCPHLHIIGTQKLRLSQSYQFLPRWVTCLSFLYNCNSLLGRYMFYTSVLYFAQPPRSAVTPNVTQHTPKADTSAYENLARVDSFEPLSVETSNSSQRKSPAPVVTPLLAAALPPEFVNPSAENEFEVIEEIHDLVINRQPGQGLGLSIAGGKGSPPYKGSDAVRFF